MGIKKSIITDFSSGTPSSTYSVATGYSVGSEWVNTDNGNRFYHKTDGNWVLLGTDSFTSNILITSTSSITTETLGVYGGINYPQNGRNIMIDNSNTAINITATGSVTNFIASYTKIGTADITFLFTGTFSAPYGTIMDGLEGSTALLTKSQSKFYLLLNNI